MYPYVPSHAITCCLVVGAVVGCTSCVGVSVDCIVVALLLPLPALATAAITIMSTTRATSDPQPMAKNLPLVRFFGAGGGGATGYDGYGCVSFCCWLSVCMIGSFLLWERTTSSAVSASTRCGVE